MIKTNNACSCGCCSQDLVQTKGNCPVRNNKGEAVGKVTVEHLVSDDNRKAVEGDQYRICLNEECDVVYYNVDNGVKFLKNQIKVPIWFKKDANPNMPATAAKLQKNRLLRPCLSMERKRCKK